MCRRSPDHDRSWLFVEVPRPLPLRRSHVSSALVESVGVTLLFWSAQGVSFALALSGRVEPWVAAWAPNVVFLAAGLAIAGYLLQFEMSRAFYSITFGLGLLLLVLSHFVVRQLLRPRFRYGQ